MGRTTDTEWLEQLRRGGTETLAEMFDQYKQRLRQMVALRLDRRVAARLDASDVLQETFLDARRQLHRYLNHPRVAPYVWLRELARERLINCHRDNLASQRRAAGREMRLPEGSSVDLASRLIARQTSPSEAVLRREIRETIERAIGGLPPEDRDVILMRHFEQLSNHEVAQVLGLSESGATMRYGRALFRLKERLRLDFGHRETRPLSDDRSQRQEPRPDRSGGD